MIAGIFNQRYKLLAISTLLLLGALIYSGTFFSSFHFDDTVSIVNNPAIRNIFNLKAIWNSWPTRFITYLSISLNYHFSHLKVFGYHLFNFLAHICASIMVWWFILLTFSTPAMRDKSLAKYANLLAFFGGLVFMAHPVQTQAVTYIIQRATSLTALFYVACLSMYVKSRLMQQQSEDPVVSRLFYCGSFVAAIMAMFTKEIAVTLPFIVLLYEVSFLKKEGRFNWKYPISFFAILPIIPLAMFFTKSVNFVTMQRVQEGINSISSWNYLLTQLRVMVTYIRLLFIPVNQNLDYDYHIAKSLLELPTLASLIFLVSILIIAVKIFSKHRLISFGIFWFFITLLPESSIIPIKDVIFEHRLYLPMVGFSLFLVSVVYFIFKNKTLKLMVVALLGVTICYASLSYSRNLIWKNDLTLWSDIVNKSPNKARPYNGRGFAYAIQNNFAQAISDYDKAIEIDPNFAEAYYNRGLAFYQQGNLPRSISDFKKVSEINPDDARAHNGYGLIYYKQGNFAGSISAFGKAIEIDPNFAEAYYNRGLAFYQQGNLPRSIDDFSKAIEINSDDARAYNGRGFAYAIQNNLTQAVSDFGKAIEIDPNFAQTYYNRGLAYYQQGNLSRSISDFNRAIEINSNNAEAYYNRAVVYFGQKDFDKAWEDVHKAEELGHAINSEFLAALKKASGRDI